MVKSCVALVVLALTAVGCGSKSSSGNSTTAATIPASYTSNGCNVCHGADASSLPPEADSGHVIKGTKLTETAFSTIIRNGEKAAAGGTMATYAASAISDADIQQLYNYATAQ